VAGGSLDGFADASHGAPLSALLALALAANVLVVNRSDFDVRHLYLTYADSDDWGEDQLGPGGLPHRTGRVRLTGLACETYDVRLESPGGRACEVDDVEICDRDEVWTITNEQLRACVGWSP
jgi:hypothetical protein